MTPEQHAAVVRKAFALTCTAQEQAEAFTSLKALAAQAQEVARVGFCPHEHKCIELLRVEQEADRLREALVQTGCVGDHYCPGSENFLGDMYGDELDPKKWPLCPRCAALTGPQAEEQT